MCFPDFASTIARSRCLLEQGRHNVARCLRVGRTPAVNEAEMPGNATVPGPHAIGHVDNNRQTERSLLSDGRGNEEQTSCSQQAQYRSAQIKERTQQRGFWVPLFFRLLRPMTTQVLLRSSSRFYTNAVILLHLPTITS